jgi:hypothetical protein
MPTKLRPSGYVLDAGLALLFALKEKLGLSMSRMMACGP